MCFLLGCGGCSLLWLIGGKKNKKKASLAIKSVEKTWKTMERSTVSHRKGQNHREAFEVRQTTVILRIVTCCCV